MFAKIFYFEIKYRLKRPAVYLYFLVCLGFTFLSFALGAMPLDEKQFINGTSSLAFFIAIISLMMMLVSSSIMGIPLYRDIEFNTKEYYLSYPITKAGYFWGRYLASFLFVLIINAAVLAGAYLGSKAGPVLGWEDATYYGPNHFINYLYPFLTLALPNLFFTSSLFFGLVAATKNIKVIYSGGILLFLGYLIANFFIGSSSSTALIYLTDPFAVNAVKYERGLQTVAGKNTELVAMQGLLLLNRIIWTSVGLLIILYTYYNFSFEKFFSGRRDKKVVEDKSIIKLQRPKINTGFSQGYQRRTLLTLTKIELLNIMRDNYFWIIIAGGSIFLAIVFSHGPGNYRVPDFPRTSVILFIFNNSFLLFIFCIIIFYTGETIHRERSTRFSFINDALPPADRLFIFSKILSICCLALFLTTLPMLIGIGVQLAMGFTQLNIQLYFTTLFGATLPKCIEMVMLSFMLHICVNNKFAALGIGIAAWVLFILADQSGWMNYYLLLYAFTPFYGISDMDGIGHMMKPLAWFNFYWLLFGGLLIVLGYVFYVRGTSSSFKERIQLAKERFSGKTILATVILLILFIPVAGFNYYNVSYVNHYYTTNENKAHAAMAEKKLKRYEDMPMPSVTNIKLSADLFPDQQKAVFKAYVSIVNNTHQPINSLLLDGDNVTGFTLKYNNSLLVYTSPLIYPRGKFNVFGPANDTSAYRLYALPKALAAGDSAVIEINSFKAYKGFGNFLYATDLLHNGAAMGLGLPGLGYDDDEELDKEEDRKKYGLPKREDEFADAKEAEGANKLLEGSSSPVSFDITVSTSADQQVVCGGNLENEWKANGRNYYRYTSNRAGVYNLPGILSARYTVLHDSVLSGGNQPVDIDFYYHAAHNTNLQRFMAAYKDGLSYYSTAFGPYPYRQLRLAESSVYTGNSNSMAAATIYSERFGWNADFSNPDQFDYCYFETAKQLAAQWWGGVVAPNHTKGSKVISAGLPRYAALLMMEKKYGKDNMRNVKENELNSYLWGRGREVRNQSPVLHSNRWNEIDNKAGLVLYGLKDLMGEDSLNLALHEFFNAYAYKASAPFAGSKDLYAYIKKHAPDSIQYYLTDTWEKICFYDNSILSVKAVPLGKTNQYKVTVKLNVAKLYQDKNGKETPATTMNDYIDVAVFAANTKDNNGRTKVNPLYLKKYRLTAGEHTIDIMVTGKPFSVGIDPYLMLIDRMPGDNIKAL